MALSLTTRIYVHAPRTSPRIVAETERLGGGRDYAQSTEGFAIDGPSRVVVGVRPRVGIHSSSVSVWIETEAPIRDLGDCRDG